MKIYWNPNPAPYHVSLKKAVLEASKYGAMGELSISFVSLEEIRELNRRFRDKDEPTDVLAFPGIAEAVLGDIVICTDVAEAQALEYGHSLEREMAFLVVHGFLHLVGFGHDDPDGEAKMLATQEEILNKVGLSR